MILVLAATPAVNNEPNGKIWFLPIFFERKIMGLFFSYLGGGGGT